MFKKYQKKKDGAIRFYDLSSSGTRALLIVLFIICIILVLIALAPVAWTFISGFKTHKEFTSTRNVKFLPESWSWKDSYQSTWNKLDFVKYYTASGIAVTGCAISAVVFNGLLAYVLAILRPRGHKIIFSLVMFCLLIPPTTALAAVYVNIVNIGLNGSYLPIWLSFGANAFWVVLYKQFFESIPKDYFEAARIDGCTDFQMFYKILMPLSTPIVMVILIFSVTAAWSDVLLPNLVMTGTKNVTVMMRLFRFATEITVQKVDQLRAAAFAIIPPTIFFLIFQKKITSGIAGGGIKG